MLKYLRSRSYRLSLGLTEKEAQLLQAQKLQAEPGKIGIYRVVRPVEGPYAGKLVLDFGFETKHQVTST